MDFFELDEGKQDQIFGDGDSQPRGELARNLARRALAVTGTPHKRGTLIEAVSLIPYFVVNQDLIM